MTIKVTIQDEKTIDGSYIIFQHNITENEFWEFANEDIKCELLNGVLTIHSPASTEHEDIFSYLTTIIRLYLDHTVSGKVFGSRLVMKLSASWSPEPDIMIISKKNYHRIEDTKINGPADIIFEILSPSTRETDLIKKLPEYLKNGVKEVWIIDPENKSITVHYSESKLIFNNPQSDDFISSMVYGD